MYRKIILQYSFLLYVLFVTACSEQEKPVTKQEASEAAVALTKSMAHHDASVLNEMLDFDALEKRVMDESGHKLKPAFVTGAFSSLRSGDFGLQIARSLGEKGTYELVKQYEKNNHQHLIFRLYNELLNYHDFELVKKGKEVKIADIFIYTTGENLSYTLAQSLLSMSDQPDAVGKLGAPELRKIQLLKNYIHDKEYEKADALYKSLPVVIREQKLYKILQIQIASGLGNDQYLKALTNFQQEYPDAPNMYLLMLDAYFLNKDYAGALKCVNNLDTLINKDPFLDYYRGLIYKLEKDHTNRLASLERLHQNMPDFSSGTVELINVYAEDQQWDKAVALTQQYRKNKNADTTLLAGLYLLHPDFKKKIDAATN
jgi:hypothetical protein